MNDGLCLGTLITESQNVRHYVVANFLFACGGVIVIDVVDFRFHFGYLLVGDVYAEIFFRLCKSDPKSAPRAELKVGRENVLHLFACVSLAKR